MFPGFNTEIECGKARFHIQTEVMRQPEPAILTLVYQEGAILNRFKRNYHEILGDNPVEEEIRYLAERQHLRVIEDLRAEHGPPVVADAKQTDGESLEEIILKYLDFKRRPGRGR